VPLDEQRKTSLQSQYPHVFGHWLAAIMVSLQDKFLTSSLALHGKLTSSLHRSGGLVGITVDAEVDNIVVAVVVFVVVVGTVVDIA